MLDNLWCGHIPSNEQCVPDLFQALIFCPYSTKMSFSFSRTLVHAFNGISVNSDASWKSMEVKAYLSYSRRTVQLYSLITFSMWLWSVLWLSSNCVFHKLLPRLASKDLMTELRLTLMSHLVLVMRWRSVPDTMTSRDPWNYWCSLPTR